MSKANQSELGSCNTSIPELGISIECGQMSPVNLTFILREVRQKQRLSSSSIESILIYFQTHLSLQFFYQWLASFILQLVSLAALTPLFFLPSQINRPPVKLNLLTCQVRPHPEDKKSFDLVTRKQRTLAQDWHKQQVLLGNCDASH